MITKMSLDGLQIVNVPVEKAVITAINKLDEWNLDQLQRIISEIKQSDRITKADYDYVCDYIKNNLIFAKEHLQ